MSAATVRQFAAQAETVWGQLPAAMRVLLITGPQRGGTWLAEAFHADSATDITLIEAAGAAEGLALLNNEHFDAVLISHEGPQLDAFSLLDAIRGGSSDSQPVIILGEQNETELAALCYEAGGDAYLCVHNTTTRTLLWRMAMARQRHLLLAENRRLRSAQRHQLALEHQEANRLLHQQRAMLEDLEALYSTATASLAATPTANMSCHAAAATSHAPLQLPEVLIKHYRELLRAYVIMGSGNLAGEMGQLAAMLAAVRVSPHQAMRLHLEVLEEMIRGLGSRSSRHVMNRADMLILEIMINLAEEYRERAA